MAALFQTENIKGDRWLSGLVDVMEDMSVADDVCRAANPAAISRLLAQLENPRPARKMRVLEHLA